MRPTFIMLFSRFIRSKSSMQQFESSFIILHFLQFPCYNSCGKVRYARFLPCIRDFFIWDKFGYSSFREIVHLAVFRICFEEAELHFPTYLWLQNGLIRKPMSKFIGIGNSFENNFWCGVNYYVASITMLFFISAVSS